MRHEPPKFLLHFGDEDIRADPRLPALAGDPVDAEIATDEAVRKLRAEIGLEIFDLAPVTRDLDPFSLRVQRETPAIRTRRGDQIAHLAPPWTMRVECKRIPPS